ncbi:MAG: SPW repeat protein [Ardenticatenaceae bacterium]|nr:SPW repeat protein [Ardenticatenaceae bacterium]
MYWVTLILGLVLILAPFILGYNDNASAFWTSFILGAVMALVSGYKAAVRDFSNWEYAVAGLAGLLAIIAPFVLGFTAQTTAMWTIVVLGVLALIVSIYQMVTRPAGR